ncbi:mini-chromosome maintenance complex-binding protein [Drosophila subpulchrella]|uniref:mini-chromosome maintenance complex-binding protein n=1 Tax=Drosophila subpulchrella TaxID=1486046 RepID=UPI0018A1B3F4|nr:mini-chromosome maintenance complex-binding protein [Drosophila subpulchrella]
MPCAMDLPCTPDELAAQHRDSAGLKELLKDPSRWHSIPLLNYTPLHKLKDQTLVRFRGMIQDMMDPEIYLERYEVKSPDSSKRLQDGKYRDCLKLATGEEIDYHAEGNVHGERRTMFVISVPGLNEWSTEHEKQCCPQIELVPLAQSPSSAKKRTLEEQDAMEVDGAGDTAVKRPCIKDMQTDEEPVAASNSSVLASEYLLNSPLPDRPSMACMVKVYEEFDTYQLNTLVDFVGFLSVDSSLDFATLDIGDCENLSELQAAHPSPFLIPRLHAFGVQMLPHANPLMDLSLRQPIEASEEAEPSQLAVHKDLRMLLKLCLFDDDLAAEYLLSHLISSVYSRSEMQSIGKFALNLCNLPKDCQAYSTSLYDILKLLLPASHYLPMTLETLNTVSFAPKKDYETNKLVSGVLQLAPHTHLVLDETRLQQGKLEANGVHAVQHLAHLINNQELKCDFQYYQIDYHANIPVLVLSEGRSMLPSDFVMPINADAKAVELFEESLKAAHHYLQPARLHQFRKYLTTARISSFNVSEEHTEMIQQYFVDMRKANSKSNADDLHGLLVLSRLLGIAQGKDTLDKETWQLATEFEAKRRQRLQSLPKAALTRN